MWSTFFRDGGFGMIPTSVFGFVLVLSAALCVLRPERRCVMITAALTLLTLSAGALGTCIGVAKSLHYLPAVTDVQLRFTIAGLGFAESLNNLVLALVLVVFSALLLTIAAARAAVHTRDARA